MANIKRYKKLRKEGYTILGLYKIGRENGLTPDEIVAMLDKVMPEEGHDDVVKFMRKMEFGEEYCMTCQRFFIDKPGEYCDFHCKDCQKKIDEMWEKVYDAQKETGEELSGDEEIRMAILIGVFAAMDSLVVQEADGTQENQGSETKT